MRSVPAGIEAKIAAGHSTLVRCWKVTRQDGQVYGFTEHDRPISALGMTFEAATGLSASVAAQAIGFGVANHEIVGGLSSEAITEADIAAGRWDHASVEVYLVDWQEPDDTLAIFTGTIGEMRRTETVFRADVEGPQRAARAPQGRIYQRRCDAVLGDERCGVDLSSPTYSSGATVDAVVSPTTLEVSGLGAYQERWFDYGHIVWSSGANAGLETAVKGHRTSGGLVTIDIWEEPPAPVTAGDTFTAFAGCDKRGGTCRNKFSNMVNFRGFETMPGDVASAEFAGTAPVVDGSSRYDFD